MCNILHFIDMTNKENEQKIDNWFPIIPITTECGTRVQFETVVRIKEWYPWHWNGARWVTRYRTKEDYKTLKDLGMPL